MPWNFSRVFEYIKFGNKIQPYTFKEGVYTVFFYFNNKYKEKLKIKIDITKISIYTNDLNEITNIINFSNNFKNIESYIIHRIQNRLSFYISMTEKLKKLSDKVDIKSMSDNEIDIDIQIIPTHAIFKNKMVQLVKEDVYIISNLKFVFNCNYQILNAIIDNKHPNANKNGDYCLGSYKFSELNEDNILCIINNIKFYKLNDCYYIPTNLKYILNS